MIFIKKDNANFSLTDYWNNIKSINQEGLLDGRVKLYHGTSSKNEIYNKGLLGKFNLDPNNITNTFDKSLGIGEGKPLIYLSKDKFMPGLISNKHKKHGKTGDIIELSIPIDVYKKMKFSDNPETRGRTLESHIKDFLKNHPEVDLNDSYIKKVLPDLYNNTIVINGNISPKFIKGSKKYKSNSIKELLKYIKNNPKRFSEGLIRPITSMKTIFK